MRAITGGGADFALESTGRPQLLEAGIEALASLGTIGVVGAPKLGTKAGFDVNNLLLGGRSIRGIVEGDSVPQVFIPQLVTLYQQGRFPDSSSGALRRASRSACACPGVGVCASLRRRCRCVGMHAIERACCIAEDPVLDEHTSRVNVRLV
ncbi:zinc-binding dehydrogenase [Pantoea ananatis]|uniref:zinc-binding dehydrogenase n=1 Tax=Pantoea ananas TaxID=553 RepID=UPI0039B91CE4